MADLEVSDEEILMYDADGNVTEDEDKAVTAEVTQTMADGSVRHTLMRSSPSSS
jgi:hypothetical protein